MKNISKELESRTRLMSATDIYIFKKISAEITEKIYSVLGRREFGLVANRIYLEVWNLAGSW